MKISGLCDRKNHNLKIAQTNPKLSFNANIIFDKSAVETLEQPEMQNIKHGFYLFEKWAKEFLNQDSLSTIHVFGKGRNKLILTSNNIKQNWILNPYRNSIDVFKDLSITINEVFHHLTKDSSGNTISPNIFFKPIHDKYELGN